MNNYITQRDLISNQKLRTIVAKLPEYCTDYFISIEQTTSPLTRLNYATDLTVFYYFLSKEILNIDIKNISIDCLNNVKAKDIELFLSYLDVYKRQTYKPKNL